MGHIQDRWFRKVPDPTNPKKVLRIPTDRNGIGKRYRARFIDPEGNERSESFSDGQYKLAQSWLAKQEVDVALGTFVDPAAGKISVEDFGTRWLADLDIDELSRQNMEMRFRKRVFPYLGRHALGGVKPSAVRTWDRMLREDGLSDRYRYVLFGNVSAMFTAALDDELIAKHPMAGKSVKAPKAAQKKIIPWPDEQVWNVQHALAERYRIAVDLGAGLGLRQGECFGLAVDDLDFGRKVAVICRQVKIVRYRPVFALPKYDKIREIPLSDPVMAALKAHMEAFPPVEVTLPWDTAEGKPTTVRLVMTSIQRKAIRNNDFNREYWKPALKAAGVPYGRYENGMHELRHFFASALLDGGESIKAVAEWLGHADASFTLKIYTHLMPSSSDRTRKIIGAVYGKRHRDGPDGPSTAQYSPEAA
ncbi:site-specific integrase [Actinokineospora sp. UTMC 2448]|uniref:tyrosine-type recombinase/integrase n=1 Tax=Actinokineospora sp. UTMC 2448 TaxID=2268449 RepID=UPI0021642293|nr:site-specific integrase [Actinokineospora sp. UTMC 2448]UVS81708.1 Tyrosine recombinase XerD [Actinokineospora sp. UTMC 2448]